MSFPWPFFWGGTFVLTHFLELFLFAKHISLFHPKHEVMWQFWCRRFGWCKKVGAFTMAISNPHILGIPQQSAAWPLSTWEPTSRGVWWRGWWEDGLGILWSSKRWSLGLFVIAAVVCGIFGIGTWKPLRENILFESFWHEPPPKSSLPGEYERNPNRLGYPIYPIILGSFSYLRRLWTLGISTRNESTISLYELSLWCFCFWMLDFMVSPTMKISKPCTVYNIYICFYYMIIQYIYIYTCTVYTGKFPVVK